MSQSQYVFLKTERSNIRGVHDVLWLCSVSPVLQSNTRCHCLDSKLWKIGGSKKETYFCVMSQKSLSPAINPSAGIFFTLCPGLRSWSESVNQAFVQFSHFPNSFICFSRGECWIRYLVYQTNKEIDKISLEEGFSGSGQLSHEVNSVKSEWQFHNIVTCELRHWEYNRLLMWIAGGKPKLSKIN